MTWDQLTDLGAWQYIMFADEQRDRVRETSPQ
jgi:hypothetical protein